MIQGVGTQGLGGAGGSRQEASAAIPIGSARESFTLGTCDPDNPFRIDHDIWPASGLAPLRALPQTKHRRSG